MAVRELSALEARVLGGAGGEGVHGAGQLPDVAEQPDLGRATRRPRAIR